MLNKILGLLQPKRSYRRTKSKYVTWNAYYKLKHQLDALSKQRAK
jgi:hypothetical protein